MRTTYDESGYGLWRCNLKADGASIGICGFVKRDGLEHPDVGSALLDPWWGAGYATEAAEACLRHGREALGLSTTLAITTPANGGSISVLRKIGMQDTDPIAFPGASPGAIFFTT